MGGQVAQIVSDAADCELGGTWSRENSGELDTVLEAADVAIDFTLSEATATIVDAVERNGTPLVCGVTGLAQADIDAMSAAARNVPILWDRNMSVGIATMSVLAQEAAGRLGASVAVKISETHHVHKKDAPSGTALLLRESLNDDRIEIESRREGEVVGEHAVCFVSDAETLEIRHHVSDRRVFAEGAVRAARWLVSQPPGVYRMTQIGA